LEVRPFREGENDNTTAAGRAFLGPQASRLHRSSRATSETEQARRLRSPEQACSQFTGQKYLSTATSGVVGSLNRGFEAKLTNGRQRHPLHGVGLGAGRVWNRREREPDRREVRYCTRVDGKQQPILRPPDNVNVRACAAREKKVV
jgi:hypothetical protein